MKEVEIVSNSEKSDKEDSVWITAFLENQNPDYWGRLYEKHKQQIFVHCFNILKNQEEAIDCTAEAFVRAFKSLNRFDPAKSFTAWLRRIAANLCIDLIRGKSRHPMQPLDSVEISIEDDSLERQELQHKILKCVRALKQVQRRCFCLFYIHELSYKEIAEMTGFTLNEVRSYIQNSRRNFKNLMETS